jgi:hypothetical protein
MPNHRRTGEKPMGKLPKAIAGMFVGAIVLLFLAACVGFYGYLSKPAKQRGAYGVVTVTYWGRPQPPSD